MEKIKDTAGHDTDTQDVSKGTDSAKKKAATKEYRLITGKHSRFEGPSKPAVPQNKVYRAGDTIELTEDEAAALGRRVEPMSAEDLEKEAKRTAEVELRMAQVSSAARDESGYSPVGPPGGAGGPGTPNEPVGGVPGKPGGPPLGRRAAAGCGSAGAAGGAGAAVATAADTARRDEAGRASAAEEVGAGHPARRRRMTTAIQEVAVVAKPAAASFIVKIQQADGSVEGFAAERYRYRFADVVILDVLEPGATVAVSHRLEPGTTAYIMTSVTGDTIEQIHGRRRGGGGPPR